MGKNIEDTKVFMVILLVFITHASCFDTSRCERYRRTLSLDLQTKVECKEKGM